MHFLQSIHKFRKATENIPDLLTQFVGICTVLMWGIYFYRVHEKKIDKKTRFLRLAATALPAAYLLKDFFKFMFGRTDPRPWLLGHKPLEFIWFYKIGSGSFPSGHMTVFAALGTAILFYYPQYRRLVSIILFFIGFALIVTDYHFLSDVIAGAYLGIITTYSLHYVYEKGRTKL